MPQIRPRFKMPKPVGSRPVEQLPGESDFDHGVRWALYNEANRARNAILRALDEAERARAVLTRAQRRELATAFVQVLEVSSKEVRRG